MGVLIVLVLTPCTCRFLISGPDIVPLPKYHRSADCEDHRWEGTSVRKPRLQEARREGRVLQRKCHSLEMRTGAALKRSVCKSSFHMLFCDWSARCHMKGLAGMLRASIAAMPVANIFKLAVAIFIKCVHGYLSVEKASAFIFHSSMKELKNSMVGNTLLRGVCHLRPWQARIPRPRASRSPPE